MNILLVFLFLPFVVRATELQENIYTQADKFYHNHAFKEALDAYTSISEKNSAVWENMGNCAYYLEDFPRAVLYWRKAQRESDDRNFVLQERIAQVFSKLGIEDQKEWQDYLSQFFPYWLLPMLFLLSWTFLLLLGPTYYRRNRRLSLTSLVGITFFCGMLYRIQHNYIEQKTGVVISSHTALHTGTDDKLPVITRLKAAQEIKIKDKQLDWYRVSMDSYTGWIHKDMIEIV